MQNDSDQLIKKMAKLLKEGATMLNNACPKCNTLIYKLRNGKIVCPSCNSEIIIQKETTSPQEIKTPINNVKDHNFTPVLNSIFMKVQKFSDELQQESDIIQIEKLIHLIEKLLDLYVRISKI